MSAPTAPGAGPHAGGAPASVAPAPAPQSPASLVDEHPEVLAAGAFAGGFLLAMILRRLG